MFLDDVAQGRDNNFNLLRVLAASAVLVSHAYPIALGPGTAEPLEHLTGYSLGAWAVFVFFAISGFLITASFERSSSWQSFAVARVLRLAPGLLVNLLFVAFLLGPVVTSLSLAAYFTNSEVYAFVLHNMSLIRLQFHLPGVFDDLPYTAVVGSIWTLVHEVACYLCVFVGGLLGLIRRRGALAFLLLGFLGLWLAQEALDPSMPYLLNKFLDLALPFALGAAFHVWRHWLPMTVWGLVATAVAPVLLHGTLFYYPLLTLAVGYWTFWLAYMPGRGSMQWIRGYNRIGDYSYGVYVYAFPLQGFAVWLLGPQTAVTNMVVAMAMTLPLSILSWHYVEEPALGLKRRIVGWITPGRGTAPDPASRVAADPEAPAAGAPAASAAATRAR